MSQLASWFPQVSVATLDSVESRLGVKLPDVYREFLRVTNGFVPQDDVCFSVPQKDHVLLSCLFGIGMQRDGGDLEYEQQQATLWDPLPQGYVAIGSDPGGNLLMLATLGESAGHVYFWDRVGFWVGADGQNTFVVADSFARFVDSLRPFADGS